MEHDALIVRPAIARRSVDIAVQSLNKRRGGIGTVEAIELNEGNNRTSSRRESEKRAGIADAAVRRGSVNVAIIRFKQIRSRAAAVRAAGERVKAVNWPEGARRKITPLPKFPPAAVTPYKFPSLAASKPAYGFAPLV